MKKKINPTRVSIEKKESIRWLDNLGQSTKLLGGRDQCVHIGDQESDIYELFCLAHELGTHFLLRTCVNRRAGDGDHTVAGEMGEIAIKKRHRIGVRDESGDLDQALLEIRYRKIRALPSIGKWKRYPLLALTVIHAEEAGTPRDRKKITWKLITNLPVESGHVAVEKLEWYAMRWKIEVFHSILKSGCRAEDSGLRTAQRLANLIAVPYIVSWRVFWMTMLNRAAPDSAAEMALTCRNPPAQSGADDAAECIPPVRLSITHNWLRPSVFARRESCVIRCPAPIRERCDGRKPWYLA